VASWAADGLEADIAAGFGTLTWDSVETLYLNSTKAIIRHVNTCHKVNAYHMSKAYRDDIE